MADHSRLGRGLASLMGDVGEDAAKVEPERKPRHAPIENLRANPRNPRRTSSEAELEELAKRVHTLLGLRHFSRTDFMIHPRRGVYVLEVNTLPGMTEQSLIPKALRAVGSDLHELVHHIVQLEMGE